MTNLDPKDLLQQFASDNYAGICPEAWSAIEAANRGHAASYGDDPWTARAADAFRELFETECEVFFVFNGTAANSLALASLCQSYHGSSVAIRRMLRPMSVARPSFFRTDPNSWSLPAQTENLPRKLFMNWPPSVRTFTIPSRVLSRLRNPPRPPCLYSGGVSRYLR